MTARPQATSSTRPPAGAGRVFEQPRRRPRMGAGSNARAPLQTAIRRQVRAPREARLREQPRRPAPDRVLAVDEPARPRASSTAGAQATVHREQLRSGMWPRPVNSSGVRTSSTVAPRDQRRRLGSGHPAHLRVKAGIQMHQRPL